MSPVSWLRRPARVARETLQGDEAMRPSSRQAGTRPSCRNPRGAAPRPRRRPLGLRKGGSRAAATRGGPGAAMSKQPAGRIVRAVRRPGMFGVWKTRSPARSDRAQKPEHPACAAPAALSCRRNPVGGRTLRLASCPACAFRRMATPERTVGQAAANCRYRRPAAARKRRLRKKGRVGNGLAACNHPPKLGGGDPAVSACRKSEPWQPLLQTQAPQTQPQNDATEPDSLLTSCIRRCYLACSTISLSTYAHLVNTCRLWRQLPVPAAILPHFPPTCCRYAADMLPTCISISG